MSEYGQDMEKKQGQVNSQISSCERALELLAQSIDSLTKKVEIISFVPAPTKLQEGSGEQEPTLVPLAMVIRKIANNIQIYATKINNLKDRIEL